MWAGPAIDDQAFAELRRAMELEHFKWDAQVGDTTALAPFPIVIAREAWQALAALAERLAAEVVAVEREVVARPELLRVLAIPRALHGRLRFRERPRVMRFDFHDTRDGWRISEVNSDVPGGFTEATHFTRRMAALVGMEPAGDPTAALVAAIARTGARRVDLVVAPGHMEDHQVVAHLAAQLREHGVDASVVAPGEARAACVFRFFPIDRLVRLPRGTWEPLCDERVINPSSCAISESKRLPLVWDALATPVPVWRATLPETRAVRGTAWLGDGWIVKSAFGDTGETVVGRAITPRASWPSAALRAWWDRRAWVAQRRFEPVPVERYQVCVGVYVVDGAAAGAYARLTEHAVIDYRARDAALVIA